MRIISDESAANLFVLSIETMFKNYVHKSDNKKEFIDFVNEFNLIKILKQLLIFQQHPIDDYSQIWMNDNMKEYFDRLIKAWRVHILDTIEEPKSSSEISHQISYARILFMLFDDTFEGGLLIPTQRKIDSRLSTVCGRIYYKLHQLSEVYNDFTENKHLQILSKSRLVNDPLDSSDIQYLYFVSKYLTNPPTKVIGVDGHLVCSSISVGDITEYAYEVGTPSLVLSKYQLLAYFKQLINTSPFCNTGKEIIKKIQLHSQELDVNYQEIINTNFSLSEVVPT